MKKRSILTIPNESEYSDMKCLPRAIIVGKTWADCDGNVKKYREIFHNKNKNRINLKVFKLFYKSIIDSVDGFFVIYSIRRIEVVNIYYGAAPWSDTKFPVNYVAT